MAGKMAGKKRVIETGVDKLVQLVQERKRLSVKDAAKDLGVSMASIEEWADFLEEAGLITIQTKFATLYLVEREMSSKDIVAKLREAKGEKEDFLRRIESSVNALDRDRDEVKLVSSEFSRIQSLLENNFETLKKKLEKLDDFRKSTSEIDVKEKEIERTYEKRLDELESKFRKAHSDHEKVLKQVQAEIDSIKGDAQNLLLLQKSQKDLQVKVSEAHKMLDKVESDILKENEGLTSDMERVAASNDAAEKIKKEISSGASELVSVTKALKASREEFRKMESEFRKDLELLGKGDITKVGAYKQSRELMDKFQKFLAQSKDMKELVKSAEKEEAELRKHFVTLVRRAQMFQVVAKSPKLKNDIAELGKELENIDAQRSTLSAKLRKLRMFMRSVVK